jgi:hypothetical protein
MPEDDILHSHCRENLKSYILNLVWNVVAVYANKGGTSGRCAVHNAQALSAIL